MSGALSQARFLERRLEQEREVAESNLRATVQTMLDHLHSELQPAWAIEFEPSYRSVFRATLANAALARDIILEACEDAAWVKVPPELFAKWLQLFDGVTNYFTAVCRSKKGPRNIVVRCASEERARADATRAAMKRALGKRVVRAWRAAALEALWAPDGRKGRQMCADWEPSGAKRRWYESCGGTALPAAGRLPK